MIDLLTFIIKSLFDIYVVFAALLFIIMFLDNDKTIYDAFSSSALWPVYSYEYLSDNE